ncbi:MAG: LOG family protein [Salinigranum sp.]
MTELVVTETKDQRKERMIERADGFVAFPGGIGTHEEVFDVLGRAKHGFHRKPCGLLNVEGYYDRLVAHLDHAEREGFLSGPQRDLVLVESDAAALLEAFETYRSPIGDA